MLTREFIKVALLKMSLQYPFFSADGNENSEMMVDTWHEHFKDTSREGFNYAVSTHIDTSAETPTIAHLKRILNIRPRETAGEQRKGTYTKGGWVYEPGKPKRRPWEVWCTPEENRVHANKLKKILEEKGIRRF